jgi:hypothetical protein
MLIRDIFWVFESTKEALGDAGTQLRREGGDLCPKECLYFLQSDVMTRTFKVMAYSWE